MHKWTHGLDWDLAADDGLTDEQVAQLRSWERDWRTRGKGADVDWALVPLIGNPGRSRPIYVGGELAGGILMNPNHASILNVIWKHDDLRWNGIGRAVLMELFQSGAVTTISRPNPKMRRVITELANMGIAFQVL